MPGCSCRDRRMSAGLGNGPELQWQHPNSTPRDTGDDKITRRPCPEVPATCDQATTDPVLPGSTRENTLPSCAGEDEAENQGIWSIDQHIVASDISPSSSLLLAQAPVTFAVTGRAVAKTPASTLLTRGGDIDESAVPAGQVVVYLVSMSLCVKQPQYYLVLCHAPHRLLPLQHLGILPRVAITPSKWPQCHDGGASITERFGPCSNGRDSG